MYLDSVCFVSLCVLIAFLAAIRKGVFLRFLARSRDAAVDIATAPAPMERGLLFSAQPMN